MIGQVSIESGMFYGIVSLCYSFVVFKKTGCFVRGLVDLSTLSTDAAGHMRTLKQFWRKTISE